MASLAQIRNKANAVLSNFWDALILRQEAYFLKHGRFFTLDVTNSVVDGVDTPLEIRVHKDDVPLDVNLNFNSPVPFQIQVIDTVGDTVSFRAIATVELLNGDKYQISRKATPVLDGNSIVDWAVETTAWTQITDPI